MELITICLILMMAVVASSWISRILPFGVPVPIIQIILGVFIAKSTPYEVVLDPHIFFALFIPALLFLDGWRIPKDDFFKDAGTIIELSVGLVFVTVLGLGFFIHLMIPSMPLAVSLALAAILSPTDPVAVSAITSKVPMPKRLLHILEGESLLNDASGLSAFRIAVAVMLTGHFSLQHAATEFAGMALGGIAAGVVVTLVIQHVQGFITRRVGEDAGSSILVSILVPFAAYFAAEHFHFSGILAAAAAGITWSFSETRSAIMASTRMRRNSVWDMVAFSANGIIFVLLGEQFPKIWDGASRAIVEAGGGHKSWLIFYAFVITLVLLGLRFAWVWISFRFTTFRARRRGEQMKPMNWRIPAAATAAGVRGSITLAGIMTLPVMMNDGTPFPARELAIFLAAGVIILTMVIASVALPLLLKNLEIPEDDEQERMMVAKALVARAAIRAVEEKVHAIAEGRSDADLYADAASNVMDVYRRRIDSSGLGPDLAAQVTILTKIERELEIHAVRAEREELFRLRKHKKLSDYGYQKLARELDFKEVKLTA